MSAPPVSICPSPSCRSCPMRRALLLGNPQHFLLQHPAVRDVAHEAGEDALFAADPRPPLTDSSIGNRVPSARRPVTSRPMPMMLRSPVSRYRSEVAAVFASVGSGMSTFTLRPDHVGGGVPEDALGGLVEGLAYAVLSIVMMPSTLVSRIARARASSSRKEHRGLLVRHAAPGEARPRAAGAPGGRRPAPRPPALRRPGRLRGRGPALLSARPRPEEALHGHGEVVAPVAAERLGGARDLHARGESGGARRVDLAALGRVHEHGSRAVEGHERRGLRAEGRAGVGRRSASASTMLRRAGDTSAARRRSAASYGRAKRTCGGKEGGRAKVRARTERPAVRSPARVLRGDPLRGMAGQAQHTWRAGKNDLPATSLPASPMADSPMETPLPAALARSSRRLPKLDSFSTTTRSSASSSSPRSSGAFVGMLVGVFIALAAAFSGPTSAAYLTFGRLRPLHTNAAIFAFAGNAIFAAIYYSTQRLLQGAHVQRRAEPAPLLGLAGHHRGRGDHAAARHHPEQGVRRARVADRHRDHGGLGRLRASTSSARLRAAASSTCTSRSGSTSRPS